jgi:hypothetical protein
MEEQCTTRGAERQVAQFVQDHQIEPGQALRDLARFTLGFLLLEGIDEFDGGEEADLSPVMLDRLDAESGRNMGLTGAGRTSIILPGVWDLRRGLPIPTIREAANSSSSSAPSGMRDAIISSSGSRIGPWLCSRPG